MVDEQSSDSSDDDSEWNVDDPVNTKIENRENKHDCVDEDEHVVTIVPPFFQCLTVRFDV